MSSCQKHWKRLTTNYSQEFESEAAWEVSVELDGKTRTVGILNTPMLLERPDEWYTNACTILKDNDRSPQLKRLLVRGLGRRVSTDIRSRERLRKILQSDASTSLRIASVHALTSGSNGGQKNKRLLIRILEGGSDERVRAACAAGLEDVAKDNEKVQHTLQQFFKGEYPDKVRSGAARGLAKVAATREAITESLLRCVTVVTEADEFKVACAWSLESQIGGNDKITEAFISWLDAPTPAIIQRVAAQCLATKMADESVEWNHRAIKKVEHVLMSIEKPCPHALESLEELATAREVRRGLRLETVLMDSLKELEDRIEVAFVFGSTARKRQLPDSDIDVLIIGEIKLKDLSTPLRNAEDTLGRRINPVIYKRRSFREKYSAGDPFLMNVYRREKIPIICSTTESAVEDLDDELRSMVAERMASTI
jgi:predicted nucleotidyltransferase